MEITKEISNEDLLQFSKNTKIEAEAILSEANLLEILQKYGKVRVGGSFYLDMMYDPDIDIKIVSDSPSESAIKFLSEIILARSFQKYQYGDFEKFKRINRPEAHIIVLQSEYKDRKWEIEIWFEDKFNEEQLQFEDKLALQNEEFKLEVLKLKYERFLKNISKKELSSFQIYQDLLNKNKQAK